MSRPVLDLPWHPFLARLVRSSRATVVPVHFSGHNSRLFKLASHDSLTRRLSLLFRETARRIGTRVEVGIGQPILYGELEAITDKADFVDDLRRRTYALAPGAVDWSRNGRIRMPARRRPADREPRRLRAIY